MRIINLSLLAVGICLIFGYLSVDTVQAQTTTPQTFEKNLKVGSVDSDVLRLQKFLNTNGFQVATSGPGSIGNETVSYGRKTQVALSLFQDKYKEKILVPQELKKPTGNFFKATRDVVNDILKNSILKPVNLLGITLLPVTRPAYVSSSPRIVESYSVIAFYNARQSISSGSVKSVEAGGTTSFTVVSNVGYTTNPLVGGTCLGGSWDGNVYTTGVVNAHCTVRFTATPNSYTVSVSSGLGITTSPYSDSTVTHGNKKKFNVVSTTGEASVDGTCPAGTWSNTVYTTGAITDNCSVSFSEVLPA